MFERISVSRAAEIIEKEEGLVVDVRDPNTFAQGHIKGAIRLDNQNLAEFLDAADKSKPLVVVCYHGNASQGAADVLNQQGFARSYSMDGGMCEWVLTKEVVVE
ncbi:MAG: thiosulfate sulfurtransferase GlpE [Kangiellaceae bacterium]|nr:thiosulfate sulfurtransferase GlpE [Kangiellaceae bacterium]MCW9000157.1 thiosulfate sulfurtransferase GlpE [Kangiellaceae bacterium]MCW9016297.1 thiosulfate sulfurtransferase GlpE [Kangiellaceae bacterium]